MNRQRARVALLLLCMAHAGSSFADAPPGRYAVSAGTVRDTRTGLTWQQSTDGTAYNWDSAKTYCQGLALAGGAWRLPTWKELLTLVDPTRANPSIDPAAFPSTPPLPFWTAAPVANQGFAWSVDFSYGKSSFDLPSGSYRVRCVR